MSIGFKPHYFENLASAEAASFWFRGRNKIILWALEKYAPNLNSFMEIGCGTGFVISAVAKQFPNVKCFGSEYLEEGLVFARARLPIAEFMQMDARHIPYDSAFDVIGAFDVLEHIDEDDVVLKQIFKALNENGMVFITVPQHRWLWSAVDEYACHVRRYEVSELHEKLGDAGFRIVRSTSFVSFLLPAMYLSRFFQRKKTNTSVDELRINPILNKIFEWLLNVELLFIRLGICFPIGGSRLVIACKLQK